MKFDDGAYYGFEKDVDVYEVVEFTISETQAYALARLFELQTEVAV